MKYLKIQNKNLLNVEFFQLMGVSTKTEDPTKIGQHGTGLKYSVCYFLRNNIDIKLFIGTKEIKIEKKTLNLKSLGDVELVYVNNKRTSLSLNYGKQWKAWEAIREIYCNALDEELTVCESVEEVEGIPKHTTFYIEITEDVEKVIDNWEHYFIKEEPLFESATVRIYPALGDHKLRIYKQGVLVEESPYYQSNFRYDFMDCPLNELRQYRGNLYRDIPSAIFNSNAEVVKQFLKSYNKDKNSNYYENNDDWDYITTNEDSKELWKDYLYLHPQSNGDVTDYQYKVPAGLFKKFTDWGFSVESVIQSKHYYGGGSYSSNLPVRLLSNKELDLRIVAILDTLIQDEEDAFDYRIGTQFGDNKFDFTTYEEDSTTIYVFHIDLKDVNDQELEAIVSIAVNVHRGTNIYEQLKQSILFNGK